MLLSGLNKPYLAQCAHVKDLQAVDMLADKCDMPELVQRADRITQYGFASLKLEQVNIKGNVAHCVKTTPHLVVLRGLNRVLRRATNIKPSDRDTIVRRLDSILREGVAHRIYKFDIKSFFESLNTLALYEELAHVSELPRNALLVLQHFLNELRTRQIVGLPRGVQLSATLSEFALQNFDRTISLLPDVYFHARFVDDIIIVTGARENATEFVQTIKELLPFGLELNPKKTRTIDVPAQRPSSTNAVVGRFEYLGYSFAICEPQRNPNNRHYRAVQIAMAETKVRRLKTRLSLALCQLFRDGDVGRFERRLQLLTGNYNIRDFTTRRERSVGLFCNYKRVNSLSSLHTLDSFLRSALIGSRGRLAKRLAAKIPLSVRRDLLKYRFSTSFERRTFYNFPIDELADLRRCWHNV